MIIKIARAFGTRSITGYSLFGTTLCRGALLYHRSQFSEYTATSGTQHRLFVTEEVSKGTDTTTLVFGSAI